MTNAVQINEHILYGYAKAAGFIGALFKLYRSDTPINPISDDNYITTTRMSESQSWSYMTSKKYGDPVYNAILDATSANAPNSCIAGDYLVPIYDTESVKYTSSSAAIASAGTGYLAGDIVVISGGMPQTYLILRVLTVNGSGGITSVTISQTGIYSYPVPTNPVSQYYTSGSGLNATFTISWTGEHDLDDNFTYFVQSLAYDMPPQVVQCNRTINIIRPSQDTGAGYVGYAAYTPDTSDAIMTLMPASVLKASRTSAPSKLPTDTMQPVWQILIPNLGDVIVRIGDIITDDLDQEYAVTMNELTQLGWRIQAMQVVNSR